MRSPEQNDTVTQSTALEGGSGNVESRGGTFHAGVESAVLRSSVVAGSMSSQHGEARPNSPIDAAIGIKNGLLLGGAFWALAISMFAMVGYFT